MIRKTHRNGTTVRPFGEEWDKVPAQVKKAFKQAGVNPNAVDPKKLMGKF